LTDVAPTVLKLLGLPIPAHMEGQPLACLGGAEVVAPRQDHASSAIPGPHQPHFEYTPEEQAIIEQRLADLGYLE
jgi:arylsulfatase A-like enzyme